ncbi:hypothetical protein DPMN_074994 [Dreissena polymorpha]|uniref:Uncharacterized protein n=1 Tax=Dreissena polymorpha TaxID=45954 RepID=A0A9D3YJN4_DREPO|nr:hypothetical protein DPMN_074994 [Dreissena polymorpha]
MEGLPTNVVERLFLVYEVDIQGRTQLHGLFQNDAQGCNLIRARSFFSKAGLFAMELRVYCVFHSVQQDAIEQPLGMDNSVRSRYLEQELRSPVLWSLMGI